MKIAIKIVSIIAYVLLSASYFLYVYETSGFEITSVCLFVWGFTMAAWATVSGLVYIFYEQYS